MSDGQGTEKAEKALVRVSCLVEKQAGIMACENGTCRRGVRDLIQDQNRAL